MPAFSRKFVCATRDYSDYGHHVASPLFRRAFTLSALPETAEICITGQGFYQLFVNGKEITKGFLAPYISNPDDVVYFDNYDLKPYLTLGENVIGVMLGDGMQNLITSVWDFDQNIFTSSPKLALTFTAQVGGEALSFEADSFVCTEGPVTFNNHRCGVHYDARRELPGWNAPGFDASAWRKPLRADPPRGEARLCFADPISVRSEFAPVSVRPGELVPYTPRNDVVEATKDITLPEPLAHTGGYIYDFGKNSAGVFRLKIRNTTPGQKISLQCAEIMTADGRVDFGNINFFPDGYCQRDIYICKGAEEETWVPQFVYHGYQYLYVGGIRPDQATPELLTYVEINSALAHRASFACSDETVNKLYAIVDNSDQSNFHYFPTDCPHREKNGWTGDASASAEHMIFTLSVENSWHEWMNNIRAAQLPDGRIPGIVPTGGWGFDWGNGPAWDRVMFELPYFAYLYRGETAMIEENATMMLRYLELITRVRDKNGIVHWGLGDWVPAERGGGSNTAVPTGFTNGIMIMDMCRKGEIMFERIGLKHHAEFARKLGAEMREAVRKQYLDTATMTVFGNYQSGQAMAIYYDLLDPAEKTVAVRALVDMIHKNNDFLSCGYLGIRALFHVLSDYGYTDLAYYMITRPEAPSYGIYAKLGMTTLPEHFTADITGYDASYNHHFLGDIKHWFLRQLAGIHVNPNGDDPDEILIRPHFASALNFAEGSYDTPNGSVYVRWERIGEEIQLTVRPSGKVHYRIWLDNGYALDVPDAQPGLAYRLDTDEATDMRVKKIVL